jgi:hypothetical protein
VRIERKVGASAAVLGSLLLAVSGAVPAFARSGPAAGLAHATGLRFVNTANATSATFGGWVFGSKTATSVIAEFKIPTLKCTSTTSGVGPSDALITGTTSAPKTNAAGVLLVCSSGATVTIPFVVVNNTETNGTANSVHVGDLMKSTITNSTTTTKSTIQDLTVGHTFKFSKSGTRAAALQEAIGDVKLVQGGTTPLPIANFGTIKFTSGAVGGKALGSVSPRVAVNMETAAHVLQILTGALSGTTLNAFTTTFKHS